MLNRIFTDDLQEAVNIMPEYWRCWVLGKAARTNNGSWRCSMRDSQRTDSDIQSTPTESKDETVEDFARRSKTKIFQIGHDVKPPNIVHRFEPDYTEIAKKLRIQGETLLSVVVDAHDDPHVVGIKRPLGGGVDDRAIEYVQKWRFSPATRNGEPVAVAVNIEVSYRLY